MITKGNTDDASPSWSPDGKQIAFLSKRGHADPDRTSNEDLWIVEARDGAEPRQLTKTPEGEGGRPAWSPDGSRIAVLLSDNDQNTRLRHEQARRRAGEPAAADRRRRRADVYMPRSIARSRTSRGRPTARTSRSCCRTIAPISVATRAGRESERHDPAQVDRPPRHLAR